LDGEQLKEFLNANYILSPFQSGFRKQHSTISAALKAINDIVGALDNRNICAPLFIDLSKPFDKVDHCILVNSLVSIGLSKHSVDCSDGWLFLFRFAHFQGGSSRLSTRAHIILKLYKQTL